MENIEYVRVSKGAEKAMRLTSIIWGVVLIAISIVVVVILRSEAVIMNGGIISFLVPIITAAICILYIIITPAIRYKRYKYYIDDDMLIVVEGLWFIRKSIAPIERVHQISIKSGPIDRFFGMSNVIVTTAGGEVKVAFLETEVAEEISQRLKNRINRIVKAQKDAGEADNA